MPRTSLGATEYRLKGRDSRKEINLQIKLPYIIALIAEKDGKIIGSVFGTHDGRKGWINRLAVTPAYRKKGVAKSLVNEVETRIFKRGIGIIASLVEDWNKTSLQVFKQLGYTKHSDIVYFSKRKSPTI